MDQQENREKWVVASHSPGFYSKDATAKDYLPLTVDTINSHLCRGGQHVGLYMMYPNDSCKLLVCDFDDGTWREDARAYAQACRERGIDALAEISRSGDGAHVWIFFDKPISASIARRLGFGMLRRAMEARPDMDMTSYDRFFPAQDTIASRASGSARLGNLIVLPLNGDCRAGNTTLFADTETWVPMEDQFAALSQTTPITAELIDSLLTTTPQKFGPEHEQIRKPSRAEIKQVKANGTPIKLTVRSELIVPTDGLPAAVIADIKHRAVIPNPEFYRRQAQRFSTFGIPRVVIRFRQAEQQLLLPRGLVDDTVRALTLAGYKVSVSWPRAAKSLLTHHF